MILWVAVPSLLAALLQDAPTEKSVKVQEAFFYAQPSRIGGTVRKAAHGETVTVTGVDGRFSRCTLADGATAYILSSALIAKEEFKPAPANEQQMMELKAQGYEAGRFDPETESEFRKDKGPEMDKAYEALDALEKRRPERVALEKRLLEFRREGKLGEFSSVR